MAYPKAIYASSQDGKKYRFETGSKFEDVHASLPQASHIAVYDMTGAKCLLPKMGVKIRELTATSDVEIFIETQEIPKLLQLRMLQDARKELNGGKGYATVETLDRAWQGQFNS